MNLVGADGQPKSQPNQPQVQITKDMLQDVTCEACEANVFEQVYFLKKVSAIATGAPKDQYVPIGTWRCAGCGEINQAFQLSNLLA